LRTVSDSEDKPDDETFEIEFDPELSETEGVERLGVIQDSNGTVEQLGWISEPATLPAMNLRCPLALRKSTRKITCPPRAEKDNRCFIVRMKIHGLEANVLLDSRCTSDLVSPEFTISANLKVHKLEEPVPLQLGTVGSRSKINFGLFTEFELGNLSGSHYFDVINIDHYNAIVGTVFMQKHGIVLDFEQDKVWLQGHVIPTIVESVSTFQQVQRYAMRTHPSQDE
jgi:hypothetical protein